MTEETYRYIIVGSGVAGAAAAGEIRARDADSSILLIGSEEHLPYDRPPLSKDLWLGKKEVSEILVHDEDYYAEQGIDLRLGTTIVDLQATQNRIVDRAGSSYLYEKLLLATGGTPRHLPIPGAALEGVFYYRYLNDYMRLRREVERGRTAIVVGGGFIGSEIAAALNQNGVAVRMVYPESYLVSRVFPESLGRALQERFRARGVHIVDGDRPAALSRDDTRYYVRTESGNHLEADLVIVGIGITPNVDLAQAAGLDIDDGIVVDQYLQTSHPDIYAAGDNARFPYQALGRRVRVEHWDNGVKQGVAAGANMAAAHEPFTYMPYFYSDLFEFGYEAVGDLDSRLETFADWQKENNTGVIYYLDGDRVRGVMLCNVWGKLDAARELIRERKRMRQESLRGRIHG